MEEGHHARKGNLARRFAHVLRRYVVIGLATLFPATTTLWLLAQLFRVTDRFLGRSLRLHVPGLGLGVSCLLIVLVGMGSSHLFGREVLQVLQEWFTRLPLVKRIYPSAKQLADFLFTEASRLSFPRVGLIEFPRRGAYSLGFVTNRVQTSATGTPQTLLTLLVPHTHLGAYLVFVPEEEVVALTLSAEDALKLIFSGGVVGASLRHTAP